MPAAISACGTAPVASTTQCARISRVASPCLQACADDAPASSSGASKRAGAKHPRAGGDRGAAHDVVELLARQHRQRAGHVDAPAARADAADVARRLRLRHHLVEHAEACAARRGRRGSARRRRPCRAERRAGRPAPRRPRRARACGPQALPAGPAPMTSTSQRVGRLVNGEVHRIGHGSQGGHGAGVKNPRSAAARALKRRWTVSPRACERLRPPRAR